MRIFSAALCLFLLSVLPTQALWAQAASGAQHAAPAAAAQASAAGQPSAGQPQAQAQAKTDPAKEADIRKLLDVLGVQTMAVQMMNETLDSMKPVLTSSLPPGDYREKLINLFLAKFRSKIDPQRLVDLAVPIYDKHLSDEEIKGLIQFYQTPLGKKTLTELPQMMTELGAEGQKWGQGMGRDSMREVLAENPDLDAALEAAAKSAQH